MSWRAPLRNKAVSTSVPVLSGCERTFRVVFVMAYRSTVNYFLSETINRIRHPLFPSYTTNDYSSELYKSLKGTASFEPREEQFTFKLEAKSGGHIEVVGAAWSEACYGSKLEFCFLLDQTFLSEPLKKLELLVSQLKANA